MNLWIAPHKLSEIIVLTVHSIEKLKVWTQKRSTACFKSGNGKWCKVLHNLNLIRSNSRCELKELTILIQRPVQSNYQRAICTIVTGKSNLDSRWPMLPPWYIFHVHIVDIFTNVLIQRHTGNINEWMVNFARFYFSKSVTSIFKSPFQPIRQRDNWQTRKNAKISYDDIL